MEATCIYCLSKKPIDQFNREHVVPSSFGNFPTLKTSPHLKKEVCKECNQYFGDNIDNVLARHSFEGLKRLEKGITSDARGAHKQVFFCMKSLSENPNKPNPIFYMDRNRMKLDIAYGVRLHKKDDEEEIANILLDPRNKEMPTLTCIDPGATFIYQNWQNNIGRFEIWCKDDRQQKVILSILQSWGIRLDLSKSNPTLFKETFDSKGGTEEFTINAFVNREIFRSVSKILFNYAAHNLGAEEVLKSEWDLCRKFTRYDISDIQKSIDTESIWDSDPKNMHFETDAIDLRFENNGGNVEGKICFYGYWSYTIVLATHRELPDSKLCGHRFIHNLEPQKAFHIKKGLGIFIPTIEMNDIGQIVKTFTKI